MGYKLLSDLQEEGVITYTVQYFQWNLRLGLRKWIFKAFDGTSLKKASVDVLRSGGKQLKINRLGYIWEEQPPNWVTTAGLTKVFLYDNEIHLCYRVPYKENGSEMFPSHCVDKGVRNDAEQSIKQFCDGAVSRIIRWKETEAHSLSQT